MYKTKISVQDRGFLYGDGIFETMRSYDGRIFKLNEHIDRLFNAAKVIKIKIPATRSELKKDIRGFLKNSKLKDASLRITVTRGEGAFTLMGTKDLKPTKIITAKKFKGYPEDLYLRGISARISSIRQDESSPLSGIKSLNFLNYIMARMDVQEKGFDEAILLNTKGYVAEAATSNIFLVKMGRLITPSPDSGILPGITRSQIIKIAKAREKKVSERAVTVGELLSADEVFLTNSLAEVLPVVKIGSIVIGEGKPGNVTKLLHAGYKKMI